MKKNLFTKNLASILVTALLCSLLLELNRFPTKVQASADTQQPSIVKDINLNIQQPDGSYKIAGITDPTPAPEDWDLSEYAWEGSKVYFGSYRGNAILFRVLDADTTLYNPSHTMLLDSDMLLEKIKFYPSDYWNDWDGSTLKEWMNSDVAGGFVNCDDVEIPGMLHTFTIEEQNAIALSAKATEEGTDGYGWPLYLNWCPLLDDKVFALDAKEASYPPFGYNSTNSKTDNRIKDDTRGVCWWLRSRDVPDNYCVGVVDWDGRIRHIHVACSVSWACPAMNLDLSKVLLASAAGTDKTLELMAVGTSGADSDIWKLTLLDTKKEVEITSGKNVVKKENIITVPYTYVGTDVSQISVMITDREYDSVDANVLYYGRLNTKAAFEGTDGNGKGTFVLPDSLPDTAKIYILAEDVNGDNYTDYASAPILLDSIEDAAWPDAIYNAPFVWLVVLAIAGTGIIAVILRRKKRNGGQE